MIINSKIINIFKPLNMPVVFEEYNGHENKYIVFSTTGDKDSNYMDDEASCQVINVGLNYFYSKLEDITLIEDIKKILKDNGFRIISSQDIHKNGTKFHNRAFYLRYTHLL